MVSLNVRCFIMYILGNAPHYFVLDDPTIYLEPFIKQFKDNFAIPLVSVTTNLKCIFVRH